MSFCNYKTEDKSEDDEDFIIDDSFSSDYNEEFRTSSSSSIKWSVDARKQNEEDWLSIERILYGEESLPEDDKTREEFLSWMRAFPHLRIVGTKIELPSKVVQRQADYIEEIIAIDPPIQSFHSEPFRLLDQELNEKLYIRKARQASGSYQSRAEDLEKLLRITSSGLTRNQPQQRPQNNKKVIDRTSTFLIKQNSVGRKLSKIQEHKKFEINPITISHQQRELDNKLSYSASNSSSSRMGPILNVKFLFKKPEILNDVKAVKSASKLPIYSDLVTYERQKLPKSEFSSKSASIHHHKINPNTIQLPPFNYDLDFPIIQGRGYNNQKPSRYIKH